MGQRISTQNDQASSQEVGLSPAVRDAPDPTQNPTETRQPDDTLLSSASRTHRARRHMWNDNDETTDSMAGASGRVHDHQHSRVPLPLMTLDPEPLHQPSDVPGDGDLPMTDEQGTEIGGGQSSSPGVSSVTGQRSSYLSRFGTRLTTRTPSTEQLPQQRQNQEVFSSRERLTNRFASLRASRRNTRRTRQRLQALQESGSPDADEVSHPSPFSSEANQEPEEQPAFGRSDEPETSDVTSAMYSPPTVTDHRSDSPEGLSATRSPLRSSRLSRIRDSLYLPFPISLPSMPRIRNESRRTSRIYDGGPDLAEGTSGGTGSHPFDRQPDPGPTLPSIFSSFSSAHDRGRPISGLGTRSSSTDRQTRRLPPALRRRTSRYRRGEDQATVLSHLLSVAAAATAASLVGNTERAFAGAQDITGDGSDGSFDGFLQALQNGSLAAALRSGTHDTSSNPAAGNGDGSFAPVNFFRMFRFGATNEDGTRNGTSAMNDEPSPESLDQDAPAGRMVPVIIVGIRSVMPREGSNHGDGATPPLFDALSNLPLTMPNGLSRGGTGTLMRRTDRRPRFSRSRRASMSTVNPFPAQYDTQRHSVGAMNSLPLSQGLAQSPASTIPTVLSESPPGPHPPPSTPAEHGLSAFSSGTNTPNRHPLSIPTSTSPPTSSSPHHENVTSAGQADTFNPTSQNASEASSQARRRRLSDSESSRYRDLGSGSSRRNGIVGDSELNAGNPQDASGSPTEGTRSWIIYVLGGSYPEDHPILTTPSLFTESPSYEDMLLLSSLIGVAKPPVATREDVESAPGVYRVGGSPDALIAERVGMAQVPILLGERCLICLCDYEISQEIRELTKCGHLYHRECIDEWLTTGRNSCPLCRGQGVDEKAGQPDAPNSSARDDAATTA